MIENIKVCVDNMNFQIQQFPARKGMRLEKKTISILSPVLDFLTSNKDLLAEAVDPGTSKNKRKGKGKSILDAEIDFSKLSDAIQKILSGLDDSEFDDYIFAMLENVFYLDGKAEAQLKPELFDRIFVGKSLTVYKLLIEVMKANNFIFFAFKGGNWSKVTDTSTG